MPVASEIFEHGKLAGLRQHGQPTVNRTAAVIGDLDWASREIAAAAVDAIEPLGYALPQQPYAAEREKLRVQHWNAGRHPGHVDTGRAQCQRKALKECIRVGDGAPVCGQPANDRMELGAHPFRTGSSRTASLAMLSSARRA